MKPGPKLLGRILALLIFAAAVTLSCGRMSPRSVMTENQPPIVALEAPRLGLESQTFRWRAHDPDGRIDHYIYAVNPASVDRVDGSWIQTNQTNAIVQLPHSAATDRAPSGEKPQAAQIFAVRAVDDRGMESATRFLAVLDSSQIAPSVYIDSPNPNSVFTPVVPPTVEIRWHGDDPDGRITKYKFHLYLRADLPALPPSDFSSWDEVNANVTSTTYTNLVQDQIYVFAISAFDDDGNYTSVFSSANLLQFAVSSVGGPTLCVQSSFFNYCNQVPGDTDLSYEIPSSPLQVSWFAIPAEATQITGYRWAVDPKGVADVQGINLTGVRVQSPALAPAQAVPLKGPHWSPWSLSNTSLTLGPFQAGSSHELDIQAKDNVGFITTQRLHLTVAGAPATHDLLVVDDTRLTPDQFDASSGQIAPPRGTWPTAAELDTFLYARGGNPWQGYPAGTLSSPGIMNGYDFDTVGTRGNLSGIVPLSQLSQYRQVMWFTDDVGATYTGSPVELLAPTTSLRFMSQPGMYNSLSAYVAQGGKLWLSGGGAAYATLIAWGRRNTPANDWTNTDLELVPGRFMYDFPHWQSAVAVTPARNALINTPDWSPPAWNSSPSIGRGWSGQGIDRTLSQPDYSKLTASTEVAVLSPRTCASDPPPPQRFCNSFYLVANYRAEFLGRVAPNPSPPNFIREDADSRPNQEQLESTLDTLYTAIGGTMPSQQPVMTYYHGFQSGPVVFSGFPIWYFQKAQCQALVDFVLHDIWGLSKSSSAPAAVASRRSRR